MPETPSINHGSGRTSVRGVLGAVLVVVTALLLVARTQPAWWARLSGPAVDPRFATLVAAVGEERYLEPRMTGGFKYGPLRQAARGADDLSRQNLQLLAAAGELQKAAASDSTAPNLHALGVAMVLLGDLRQGVDSLQRADALEPGNPAVLSDLAAALVARATQSAVRADTGAASSAEDWPRALDAAERSLAIAPGGPEAAFNRALALAALGLSDEVGSAWRAYLAIDGTSPWADEARGRLAQLTRGTRDEGSIPLWRARQAFERDLLAAWASRARDRSARLEPPPEFRQLATASDLGVIAATARAALDACAGPQDACRRFAVSHANYALAATLQGDERYGESVAPAEAAVGELDAVGSPLRHAARLLAARAELRSGDAELGRQHLREIVDASPGVDPLAHAGALAQLGIIAFSSGKLHEVEPYYTRHLQLAEASGDPAAILTAHAMLGTFSRYVGDFRTAWYHWLAAAHYAPRADARSKHTWFMAMGNASVIAGLPGAAAHVATAADANARQVHPAALVESGALRAKTLAVLGDATAAGAALQEARAALDRVPDPAFRQRLELQWLTTTADAPAGDYAAAKDAALRAIAIVRQQREKLRLPQLFLALSRAWHGLGDDVASGRALKDGADAFEAERGYLDTDQRVSYFDASWGLFADRTERALEAGDLDGALEAFAKSRARTLDEARHVAATTLDLRAVQSSLADGDALMLMSQFPRRLAVVLITAQQSAVHWVPLDEAAAQRLAKRLEAGPAVERGAAMQLFDAVLGPIRPDLPRIRSLWIVPDVPYYGVPFAALLDERTGRYLIETQAIAIAPSVDVVVRRKQTAAAPARLLAIGVGLPADGLPALPFATREAAEVAALYAESSVLVNEEATPARVLAGLRTADVAHFGAHALANEERPMLSSLAMRDGAGHSAPLFGRDLAAAKLGVLRVAVLAACGTGVGTVRRGEGPLSLARALIVGGAGTVIATLADVPDDASYRLSLAVHRELAKGARAMDALRAAQLDVIRQGAPTSAWARTVVVGQGI